MLLTGYWKPERVDAPTSLQTAGITLSPAIIAYNIDMGQEAVNRRSSELVEGGLVEKIERGRYEITPTGEQYLDGGLVVGELEYSDHELVRTEQEASGGLAP